MTQISIQDGIVQLINSAIASTSGDLTHTGDYVINGALTVDSLTILNPDATQGGAGIGNWLTNTEEELNGVGFNWAWGTDSVQLQYRTGGRIWSSVGFDVAADQSYKIDNIPVLSANSLGDSVVNSKLKTIGTLQSLKVSGDATLGDFIFVNSTFNRLGIGTEEPSSAISILDNNVTIDIGSSDYNVASVGTGSSHDFTINSDGQARITAKADGEVHIGNANAKNGILRVFGSIYVDNLVADSRINRSSPLQFNATRDQSIYGLGLQWAGTGAQRELVMYSDPDRLYTTESFDLAEGQSYYIGGRPVLTANNLGDSIAFSKLVTVGPLQTLTVTGATILEGQLNATSIILDNGTQNVIIDNKGIGSHQSITVSSAGLEAVYADANEVNIGDRANVTRAVKVFGPLSVGIANPDPTVKLTVAGDVQLGGKKFTNGTSAPIEGSWAQGDMCWNTQPQSSSYVGWICIQAGAPGTWAPFGLIS
jgi:hypothetical protein